MCTVGNFVYVGAEVSIGSFLINYFELPNIGHLAAAKDAKYVAYYWGRDSQLFYWLRAAYVATHWHGVGRNRHYCRYAGTA